MNEHGDPPPVTARRMTRRRALTRTAAMTAGAIGVGAAAGSPAAASAGDAMLVGRSNHGDTVGTDLSCNGEAVTFLVQNTGPGVALEALTYDGLDAARVRNLGAGTGLTIQADHGPGVVIQSAKAPLRMQPAATSGPPTSGFNYRGTLVVDAQGRHFICVGDGDPGTWVRPGFNPISPWRACDTRPGMGTPYSNGPLAAGTELTVALTGTPARPIPFGATAVELNLTVTGATHASHLIVYPDNEPRPAASAINFTAGQTIANGIVSKVGPFGNLKIYNLTGSVHVLVDVSGYHY
jgi:hypothetical protein